MSKNDNVIRLWRGPNSDPVNHWDGSTMPWKHYEMYSLYGGDVFCLNDAEHPPPEIVRTTSLEGLV